MAREHLHLTILDDEGGEIRGTAADVDDQSGGTARPQRPTRDRCGFGLGEELEILESCGEITVPEIGLRPGVARRIGGVKMHRSAGERSPVPDPRRRLRPLAQRPKEGGDHVREGLPPGADHPGLAHERPAQHALQRANVSTGSRAISAAPAASPIRIASPSVGKNTAVVSVSDPGWIGRRRGIPSTRMAAAEFEVPKSMEDVLSHDSRS